MNRLKNLLGRLRGGSADQQAATMARDWEERAQQNALHYIADFRPAWDDDVDTFFLTGLHDTMRILDEAGWTDTKDLRLLEIGCGVGRMTRHLAERYCQVEAIDISPTMIVKAREMNGHLPNVTFRIGNGVDLTMFPDSAFDHVLSYIVFQHIPDAALIENYIREGLRVLAPQGQFLFQARNDNAHARPNTYDGASIDLKRVERLARESGRKISRLSGEGTGTCYVQLGPA